MASRVNPGYFWTHNDSGDGPFVYAFDRRGADFGKWRVTGATAIDWEDIAIGPGPARRPHLFVGDIGDNEWKRRDVVVYRVAEPRISRQGVYATAPAKAFHFRYPDGPHDAEALLVHPVSGTIYIITKARGNDRETLVFRSAAPNYSEKMERVAGLHMPGESDFTLVTGRITGGDISPDGRRVALCDYFRGYEAVLPDGADFEEIWKQPFKVVDIGKRRQGEGICYRLDGRALLATSEGRSSPLIETVRVP
ncbi:MAG TPA: hypothetical protein VMZ52_13750 [Bryobacteraceae bacterium]|nr:hypothetical protein [Bryobacteraceae bacterium]